MFYRVDKQAGAYRVRFRDNGTRDRFLAYLQLMDVIEITGWDGKNARKEDEWLKILFKDVLGISER